MTKSEEMLLLARGIDQLYRESHVPLLAMEVVEILSRRDTLVQCLQEVIFKEYGNRGEDLPQILNRS